MTTLNMYDCSADRAGALHITFYAEAVGKGDVLKTITFKPAAVVMNHSSPTSLGHKEIETVCSMWVKAYKGVNAAAKPEAHDVGRPTGLVGILHLSFLRSGALAFAALGGAETTLI